jgi:hypothetical protein
MPRLVNIHGMSNAPSYEVSRHVNRGVRRHVQLQIHDMSREDAVCDVDAKHAMRSSEPRQGINTILP